MQLDAISSSEFNFNGAILCLNYLLYLRVVYPIRIVNLFEPSANNSLVGLYKFWYELYFYIFMILSSIPTSILYVMLFVLLCLFCSVFDYFRLSDDINQASGNLILEQNMYPVILYRDYISLITALRYRQHDVII